MSNPAAGRRIALCLLLAAPLLLLLALLATPAAAATGRVTLASNGPTPQTITINRGDTVTFVNQDNSSHTITSNAGAWSYRATIPAGASATTPPFRSAGQFGYRDTYFVALFEQNANGYVSVRAPSSTASPTPKPSATKSPTPSPKPSPTKSPRGSATPTASPTPSGLVIAPGIGGLPTPGVIGGPTPHVAPSESASPTPTSVTYGDKAAIVQSSPHGFGVPVLLALLAALGVLSLIVRLLLAEPAALTAEPASRRTGEEGADA